MDFLLIPGPPLHLSNHTVCEEKMSILPDPCGGSVFGTRHKERLAWLQIVAAP